MLLSIVFRNINLHSQLLWSYQQTEQYFSGLRRENTEGVYGCGNRMNFLFFFLPSIDCLIGVFPCHIYLRIYSRMIKQDDRHRNLVSVRMYIS